MVNIAQFILLSISEGTTQGTTSSTGPTSTSTGGNEPFDSLDNIAF